MSVIEEIEAERRRQIEVEGYTLEHDNVTNIGGELARAAAAYALSSVCFRVEAQKVWPWSPSLWKPSPRRRCLIKAGALIVAETERMDRMLQWILGKDQ